MKKSYIFLWVAVVMLFALFIFGNKPDSSFFPGSVTVGNDYLATSTPSDQPVTDGLIRQGWGTLGSMVIEGAGTSEFWLLNATTSLANTKAATTSILLAVKPVSMAAGTYIYDVSYTRGLYLDVITSGTGTSTITYR